MAHSYRIYDQQGQYFVTCTVHFSNPKRLNNISKEMPYVNGGSIEGVKLNLKGSLRFRTDNTTNDSPND